MIANQIMMHSLMTMKTKPSWIAVVGFGVVLEI